MDTFGEVFHTDRTWRIQCEPHIRARLKRVFARAPQVAGDVVTISDTPENSRDLEWFLGRYPMVVHESERLRNQAKEHREMELRLADLLARRAPPDTINLALPPREYQLIAAQHLEIKQGLLLADDVGVGKTVSGICPMALPDNLPAVVVCPVHLERQWAAEIRRFAPQLRVHRIRKGKPYPLIKEGGRQRDLWNERLPDVLIVSYHKLRGWADTLAELVRYVVFDECQQLRSPGSQIYQACEHVARKARRRLGLSATPIHNYGSEFFSVIDVLLPGALGTRQEFIREWCAPAPGGNSRLENSEEFGAYIRREGIMLRRTRADVGRELPPLTRIVHTIDCDAKVIDEITGNAANLARIILAQSESFRGQKMNAAGEFDMLMRQATGIAKCLAPGTKVIKFDGSVVPVETLRVGDLLMGPDSTPRRITATTSGIDEMFEVSSTSQRPLFEPYTVNGNHILALKRTGKLRHNHRFWFRDYTVGDHIEISVRDYLTKSKHFKHHLKGYKSQSIEFPAKPVSVDPYFLGLWLGDGTSAHVAVTTMDPEIRDFIYEFAAGSDLKVHVKQPHRTAPTYRISQNNRTESRCGKSRNPVLTAMQALGVLGNKHIPQDYLVNDRGTRLALLAGLLDTDGTLHAGGSSGYGISSQWESLANGIAWLAQSLGFKATVKCVTATNQTGRAFQHYKVMICGDGLEEIPVRIPRKKALPRRQIKDPLRSGISVRQVGPGRYCGFELNGDGLFLLGDFTVTHNSPYVAEYVRLMLENGERVVLFGWHRAVYSIWLERLKDYAPAMYTGSESPAAKQLAKERFVSGQTPVLIMSLRSGSGVDGLQGVSRTAVFGELDWAPAVLEQCMGRLHRDGQADPCAAYYLITEDGSDPMMAEILGIKREQLEGVRNPGTDLIERIETGEDHIRRLARDLLERRGETISESSVIATLRASPGQTSAREAE